MRTLVVPLRLRSSDDARRKVTWLELFFDLIFVAAVAQVAAPLREAYSLEGLARFTQRRRDLRHGRDEDEVEEQLEPRHLAARFVRRAETQWRDERAH